MDRKQCISLIESGCIISAIINDGQTISGIVHSLDQESRTITVRRGHDKYCDIFVDKIMAISVRPRPADVDNFKIEIDSLHDEKLIERVRREFLTPWQRTITPLHFRFLYGKSGANQATRTKIDRWIDAVRTLQAALRIKDDEIIRQIALYVYSIKHDGHVQSEKFPRESIEEKLMAIPIGEQVTLYGDFRDSINYNIEQGRLLEIDMDKRLVRLHSAIDDLDFDIDLDAIFAIEADRLAADIAASH
ncbi:hypothetical protein [Burkholderia sp. MSMB1498]|uniref:hypothetical protein n=1 Tax=Burkholderia sp. MSMB1498 TaxID=1637842 RepID=UPI000757BA6B|nr:hypothetical protein [Burkholderia sp. MSMB1498]KVK84679.1 hypothetical protein WS91_04155 [Burkholderia sp. MSMB1498]